MAESVQGFRLSPQQARLLAASADGQMPAALVALSIAGDLDPARLRRALATVVGCHEALRTGFSLLPGLRDPVQVIAPVAKITWHRVSLAVLGDGPAGRALAGLARAWSAPRPLVADAEVNALLVHLEPARWCLLLAMSPLDADILSLDLLAAALATAYEAGSADASPVEVPAAEVQYLAFADWQNALRDEMRADADADGDRPPATSAEPPLPYERLVALGSTGLVRGATHRVAAAAPRLETLAGTLDVPLDAVVIAAWQALVWQLCGSRRGALVALATARPADELRDAIGLFASPVALPPIDSDAGAASLSLRQLARRMGQALAMAEAEQTWLEADPAADRERPPIGCVVHGPYERRHAGSLGWRTTRMEVPVACRLLLEVRVDGADLLLDLAHLPGLIGPAARRCLLDQAAQAITRSIANPEALIEEVARPRRAEPPAQGRETVSTKPAAPQAAMPIQELFWRQVARGPERVAVTSAEGRWTYEALAAHATRLTRRLVSCGIGTESRVAVVIGRRPELPVALLGVLGAGACYVPLDARDPTARLAQVLGDARPAAVVVHPSLVDRLPRDLAADRILLDLAGETDVSLSEVAPPPPVDPGQAAYVIYTSGSSGQPKGVVVSHHALGGYLRWCIERYPLGAGHVTPLFSPISFDLAVTSVLGPLAAGGTIALVPADDDAVGALARLLREGEVGLLKLTPSHLQALARVLDAEDLGRVADTLVIGGEALHAEMLLPWQASVPSPRVVNEYGPTEATVACAAAWVPSPPTHDAVPIGTSLGGAILRVLDGALEPVPPGLVGELYIGGDGLARGYYEQPGRTAERFVPDPWSPRPGGRLYRSGDRVRDLPGEGLQVLGRVDDQVKIRGVRVEPAEVETVLVQHDAVRQVAVVAEGATSERRLAAYVVAEGAPPTAEALATWAAERLPAAMVPSHLVAVSSLPLAASGKVDRQALAAMAQDGEALERVTRPPYRAPSTETERLLAGIWQQVLGLDAVGADDRFFALGGDSILATQVVFRAGQSDLGLTTRDLFDHQSLAALAACARHQTPMAAAPIEAIENVPLLPIQHWFFEHQESAPAQWNQSMCLIPEQALAAAPLAAAIAALHAGFGSLRARFGRDGDGWRQAIDAPAAAAGENAVPLVVDLAALPRPAREAALGRACNLAQRGLDLDGRLMQVALFELGSDYGQRLLLTLHHLIIDGVSWQILLPSLDRAYRAAAAGERPPVPVEQVSVVHWAQALVDFAASPAAREELSFWRRQVDAAPADERDLGPLTEASVATVRATLPVGASERLIGPAQEPYRTRVDDLLLTALVEACTPWTGSRSLLVAREGHGRSSGLGGLDPVDTCGWLTALYPLRLDLGMDPDPGRRIKAIKEQIRQVPNGGVGYGALRYLSTDPDVRQSLASPSAPAIAWNYLGRWDQAFGGGFGIDAEAVSGLRDPRARRAYPLSVTALVVDGCLQAHFTFCRHRYRRATMTALADRFRTALERLIDHCCVRQATGPATGVTAAGATPSDFPEADLDQAGLDDFLAELDVAREVGPREAGGGR